MPVIFQPGEDRGRLPILGNGNDLATQLAGELLGHQRWADKQQQAQFERQQAMLAKEIKFIERFKARASHAAQVQSRVKKLDKIEKVEPPKRRQSVSFEFRPPLVRPIYRGIAPFLADWLLSGVLLGE